MSKKLLVLGASMLLTMSSAYADDGERLVRSVSSAPGVTENPEPEGEHAFIKLMNFHVPAQSANGDLRDDGDPLIYNNIDGDFVKDETTAKPLINVYVYGPVIGFENPEASGFVGHGARDAFGAVSLDDGETWKVTNLSNSADKSSFEVTTPFEDPTAPHPEYSETLVVNEARWEQNNPAWGTGHVAGEGANPNARVWIVNGVTQDILVNIQANSSGEFEVEGPVATNRVPCTVSAATSRDNISEPVPVEGAPEDCIGPPEEATLITDYPGEAINVFHAVASNKVLVAWPSRFCEAGNPAWSAAFPSDEVATYLGISNESDFYLTDLFGVGGSQSSTNYNPDNAPVGEVPYSCLWSARGVLREDPEVPGTTQVVWFQAERLTSGRRDVNRVETSCVAGAGCAITWQEDPEGIRPGEGEGPGTGWSGATAASKTDIWYSFIEWEDFDIVNDDGTPLPLADNIVGGRPMVYVPMMIAARLTNNDRCTFPVLPTLEGYCNDEFAAPYGIKDQCIDSVEVPLGPQGNPQLICMVDANGDGVGNPGDLPNIANNAATRPRLNLQPRDTDPTDDIPVDDAWVVVVSEEDKGLGRFGFFNDEEWTLGDLSDTATFCGDPDETTLENCVKADVGKNVFWTSFNLGSPATSEGVGVDYSLVETVLYQGAQLNQPEVNWRTGVYFPPMDTADMWDFSNASVDYNYLIFNTEIARRTAMMSQPLAKAKEGINHVTAIPLWKQGIVNQGGPADISTRRIALDCDDPNAWCEFDETVANPYAASNMVCAWYDGEGAETEGVTYFTEGSQEGTSGYYPNGLCMAAPINLSARTPFECEVSGSSDGLCPGVSDMTCVDDATFGQLCSSVNDPDNSQVYDKMLSWYECPGMDGTNVSNDQPAYPAACYQEPDSALIGPNLDDASWYNPLEVSKAHRGFIDGSYVSMIYAWSPNFKQNTVGNDRYELYTRRSFDGGVTWTTTPVGFEATDGVTYNGDGAVTCETWRDDISVLASHVCTDYDAGDPEQSRNVSQLKSMANTILDPRYTAAGGIPPKGVPTEGDLDWGIFVPIDPTDILNPSRYFVVFETGDNTTVEAGEAEPLNLEYGRGEMFGDNFTVWAETDTGAAHDLSQCYPNDPHDDPDADWAVGTEFCNEFDTMEGFQDALSEEASITASAYGDFLYGVWGQFNVDPDTGEFIDGDSMFRRVWYLDDYVSDEFGWTLPGTQQP
ncbi:MAG: choice-of-anchor O protein [Pseudomonadota bacterium]|nr:choice-of-anchor O protein [Pseudomonadota bacterium]